MTIRVEQQGFDEPFSATVRVRDSPSWSVIVTPPVDSEGRNVELMRWYFEDRLEKPWLGADRERAAHGASEEYGRALWRQLFPDRRREQVARAALEADSSELHVAGSSRLHAIHWELVRDPDNDLPIALQHPVIRMVLLSSAGVVNYPPPAQPVSAGPRVLVVTARPDGRQDVAPTTVSGPVVECAGSAGRVHACDPPRWRNSFNTWRKPVRRVGMTWCTSTPMPP